jgi:cytochrome c-type biogenesis protein CcmH/NrfG
MLNERLKRSAKWVYVFLALVFAVSFVVAGVGTGGPALSDLLQNQQNDENNAADTAPESVQDAERATRENPDDPQAWLRLADAHRDNGDTVNAVTAADKAIELAPKDADVNEAAAEIFSARAAEDQNKANQIFERYQLVASASQVPSYVVPGASNALDPLSAASQNIANERLTSLLEQAQPFQDAAAAAADKAKQALIVVTEARPDDAGMWYQLGVVASTANDTETAIRAFDTFLELVPNDPVADGVRSQLEQLDPSRAATADTAATGTDTSATGTDAAATGTDTAATGTDTGATGTEPAATTEP